MTYNNYTIIKSINTLEEYSKKHVPQSIAYAILRDLKNLSEVYKNYEKELVETLQKYKDSMTFGEDGSPKLGSSGLPIVSDDVLEDYNKDINALLGKTQEVNMAFVDEKAFDYDSDKYDPLTVDEMVTLQGIICNQEGDKA